MIFTTLLSADTVLQVSKNPWSYVISWAIQYPKKEYFWTLSYKKLWRIFMFIYIAVSSFLPCFLVCNLFCKRYFRERGKHDRLLFNTKCQIAYHISISPQKFFIEPRQEILVQGFKFLFVKLYGSPGSHLSRLLNSFQRTA